METITVQLNNADEFDNVVHGKNGVKTLPDSGDLTIITKDAGTVEGRPVAVISFTVEVDGKIARAQTVNTVRNLLLLLEILNSRYNSNGELRPSNVKFVNPSSPMSCQLSSMPDWDAKLLAITVQKMIRENGDKYKNGITLGTTDIQQFAGAASQGARLLTHGDFDSITLKIVTAEEAETLVNYDSERKGNA